MTVHEFMRSHQDQWHSLEEFLAQAQRLSLPRVPLEEFRHGSLLYRQAVADLAYARMRFGGHPVVRELERLAGLGHSLLYQAGRSRSRNWSEFWRRTWPARVREAAGPIFLATGIFWVGALAGFVLTTLNPVLEGLFISPPMRQAINSGRLWTEAVTAVAPAAGSKIATNNIQVSFMAWGLGLTFGIGTVWLVTFNGLMLGAVAAACLRAGMLGPLAEFIIGHGSLELPAIWISAGAGLMLARALLFPGRYRRGDELRLTGRRSVQIMVGIVPILLIAAGVEAFVSPSNLAGIAKAALGFALLLGLVAYIQSAPPVTSKDDGETGDLVAGHHQSPAIAKT
jgi:uncharacterized membrane protein SpoIIM required for sporulation